MENAPTEAVSSIIFWKKSWYEMPSSINMLELIQKELGWVPQETFETGIRKTVEWYLNNLDWCQRVQDGSYLRERLGTNN